MLMKWFDLEVGDVIKVSKHAQITFGYTMWATNELLITDIIKRQRGNGEEYISIVTSVPATGQYNIPFDINKDGIEINARDCGVFFEIVKLKDE